MNEENTHKITLFESLRGLLSFWVLFAHVEAFTGITWTSVTGFMKYVGAFDATGVFAVWVFMILSGFVISYLLDKDKEDYVRFILRRFFRIYPVFVLAICLGVLVNPAQQYIHSHAPWKAHHWIQSQLSLAQGDAQHLVPHLLSHLTMLHGVIPDALLPHTDAALNAPGWSISTEWQFYLVAPLLFAIARRRWGFFLFSAVVVLGPLLLSLFPLFDGTKSGVTLLERLRHQFDWRYPITHGVDTNAFLFCQLQWFYLGIVCFHWFKQFAGFSPAEARMRKITILLVIACLLFRPFFFVAILLWFFFFAMVMRPKNESRGILNRAAHLINIPFLQYLGRISYPVYLLHWPIVIVESRLVLAINPQIDQRLALGILIVAVPLTTIGLAHVVHRWLEMPAIRFARNLHRPPTG